MAEEDKEEEEDDEEEEFRRCHMMVIMADRCLKFCDLSLTTHRHQVLISKILFVGKRR